jgi:FkbM family methyltransferase
MQFGNRLRHHIKSIAESVAVRCPAYRPLFGRESCLRLLLQHLQIECVLDVGACYGDFAAELRRWGFKSRIISFEPVPASYAMLCKTMGNDRLWTGQPYGLSDVNGRAMMHTYANPHFNSLLNLKDEAEAAYHVDHSGRAQIEIQLHRLDEVLPDLLAGTNHTRLFLKMDTQGHDANVLMGAGSVLEQITGLQSEVPVVEIYDGMLSLPETLNYYHRCGFIPVGFYPVNTLGDTGVSPEFDVLLKRFEGSLRS